MCFRQSNPDISNFMKKWNMTSDYHKLESIYIKKLLDIVSSYPTNNGYIVWQEVFDNGVAVKNDTVDTDAAVDTVNAGAAVDAADGTADAVGHAADIADRSLNKLGCLMEVGGDVVERSVFRADAHEFDT